MANENGLKLAFQKRYPANRVLAFDNCFMGRTLVMSQISDKPKFREGLPNMLAVDYVPFFDAEHPEESTKRAIEVLKQHIKRYPGQHAAMCMELVQGEAGFWVGSSAFFKSIIKVLKENDIVVIADEIQSFGRTEQLFAFQHFGLQDDVDVVIMGKLSQICGTLFKARMAPKPALLSQTFTASTSAIAASQYIFDQLLSGNFFGPHGKNAKVHAYFENKLKGLNKKYPNAIKGPYGTGAMIAFTPFDGSMDKALALVNRLFQNGVLSFIAGGNPTRIRFLVPVVVTTEEDIDNVTDLLEKSLKEEGA
jgi:4-aminobutyrate aminotransferase-like enzyme